MTLIGNKIIVFNKNNSLFIAVIITFFSIVKSSYFLSKLLIRSFSLQVCEAFTQSLKKTDHKLLTLWKMQHIST